MTEIATLYVLWAGFVFVSHAAGTWSFNAVPVSGADWDACLQAQNAQYRAVFQCSNQVRDVLAQSRIVLFKNVGIEGDS